MVNRELNVCKTDIFSKDYPEINNYLWEEGKERKSRYGDTKEVLNFKLHLIEPGKRCTGGYGRDINIFFLLAEALWIWTGQKDVEFLNFFNSNMINFSDDGKIFHAPYGYRLRYYDEETGSHIDQIDKAIQMLSTNSEDRRVVMSIWNPKLDLGTVSKDIPCNDLVMLKVRDNKLFATIQNRSNDLHWGLPTNVFQFSFISELIALCLGIKQGEQVHNSQSLHYYLDNLIAKNLYNNYMASSETRDLYDSCDYQPIKVNFSYTEPTIRLDELDVQIMRMITELRKLMVKAEYQGKYVSELRKFSPTLSLIYYILSEFIAYKTWLESGEEKDTLQIKFLDNLKIGLTPGEQNLDFVVLAKNFFQRRLKLVDKDISW